MLEWDEQHAPLLASPPEEWRCEDHYLDARLNAFWKWLKRLVMLEALMPGDVIAVEEPYVKFARAALVLGQLLGLVRQMAWWVEVELILVSAKEGKIALTGDGAASKAQMVAAATMQFPGPEWTEHTSDALGICLGTRIKLIERSLTKG